MKRILLASALFILSTPAFALDLTQQITLIDGKPILGQDGKPQPMTVGDIIKNTLLVTPGDLKEDEKKRRFWLALKIGDKKEITFTPQELTEIEDVLWKYQSILVAGQVVRMIDPTSVPKQ